MLVIDAAPQLAGMINPVEHQPLSDGRAAPRVPAPALGAATRSSIPSTSRGRRTVLTAHGLDNGLVRVTVGRTDGSSHSDLFRP